MTIGVIIGGLVGFFAGRVHERWARTRWIRSLPARDPRDMMMEEP